MTIPAILKCSQGRARETALPECASAEPKPAIQVDETRAIPLSAFEPCAALLDLTTDTFMQYPSEAEECELRGSLDTCLRSLFRDRRYSGLREVPARFAISRCVSFRRRTISPKTSQQDMLKLPFPSALQPGEFPVRRQGLGLLLQQSA